jgi:Na+-driven multidrug efflux pump
MPFRILLIGTFVISGWEILANDFAARGKPILNTYIIGISVLINVVLNILFIPKWGISGAAMATAISYFFMFFVTVIVYSKISGNKIKNIIFLQKKDLWVYKNLFNEIKKRI